MSAISRKRTLDFIGRVVAGRFCKALATFLSDRLRTTTSSLTGGCSVDDELDERLLDMVHVAGDRMLRLIKLMDRDA